MRYGLVHPDTMKVEASVETFGLHQVGRDDLDQPISKQIERRLNLIWVPFKGATYRQQLPEARKFGQCWIKGAGQIFAAGSGDSALTTTHTLLDCLLNLGVFDEFNKNRRQCGATRRPGHWDGSCSTAAVRHFHRQSRTGQTHDRRRGLELRVQIRRPNILARFQHLAGLPILYSDLSLNYGATAPREVVRYQ